MQTPACCQTVVMEHGSQAQRTDTDILRWQRALSAGGCGQIMLVKRNKMTTSSPCLSHKCLHQYKAPKAPKACSDFPSPHASQPKIRSNLTSGLYLWLIRNCLEGCILPVKPKEVAGLICSSSSSPSPPSSANPSRDAGPAWGSGMTILCCCGPVRQSCVKCISHW